MNPYAISPLVVACINVGICVYVLHRNPRGSLARPFALLMSPLILWPIGEALLRSVSTPELASVLSKGCWVVVAFIPPVVLNFVHRFTRHNPSKKGLCSIVFFFLVAFSFVLAISRTDYIISGVVLRHWGFTEVKNLGFGAFAGYLCILLLYGIMVMLRKVRSSSHPDSTSAEYVVIGISIPLVMGSLTQVVLPLYDIAILPIVSFSTLALSIFVGIVTLKDRRVSKIPSTTTEALLDALSDAVFVVDQEGKIVSTNKMMIQLLEYSETELLHKSLEMLVPEDERIYVAGWALHESGVVDRSVTWLSKSGRKTPVTLTTSPLKDKHDAVQGFVGVARDTRRMVTLEQIVKNSMGQLKESQEKYRTLVERSLEGIYTIVDNRIRFANQKFQQMSGYTLDELQQMDFGALVAPESLQLVNDRASRRLRGEDPPERYEFKALTKSGDVIEVEALATIIEYQGKRAIQGCVRDISESKRLREKLAALYELSLELSLSLNLDQICDRVLKIVAEVLDFDNCAVMILHDETNELSVEAQMGYPEGIEGMRVSLDGNKGITVEVARTGKPLYVPDVTKDERYVEGIPDAKSEMAVPLAVKNRVIGVLNVESRKADAFNEQDLQLLGTLGYHSSVAIQTSRLFEKITEKASELSAVSEIAKALTSSVDIEVLKPTVLEELKKAIPYDLAVLYLYDRKEGRLEMTTQEGLSADEVLERELTAMERHPGRVFTTKKPLLVNDTNNDPRVSYLETMRKPASLLYVPVIFQNQALGVIGLGSFELDHFNERHLRLSKAIASEVAIAIENARLVKDLATAKVRLEELNEELEKKVIERTKALEEAQEELLHKEKLANLGQLAGSVAHELRNPLAVIRNSLYCVNQRLGEPEQKIVRHFEIIDRQISRADQIIEDLLDYSKKKVAEKTEVQLNQFVTKVLGSLPIPSSIKIVTNLSNHLPMVRLTDDQMTRVIANIVDNAIEAMPQGGELTVETEILNGHPILRIVDTGIGIREEDKEKIYQPLFTTKARGIGLGLALSKDLAKVNGVEIELESRVDEGSSFALVFEDVVLPASETGGDDG